MTRKTAKTTRPTNEIRDYDSAWKDVIEELFEPFLAFFFPHIHQDIDFSKGYSFLSKELRKITPDSNIGKRYADELIKVYLKNGSTGYICIFIHVEVQGAKEPDFMMRMFVYHYRIFDQFRQEGAEVISLAILTDEDPNYRPNKYAVDHWGFELMLKIPLVKIIDYRLDEAKRKELELSTSAMALVVKAQLKSQEVNKDEPEYRYNAKKELIRQCYKRGYDREQIRTLLKFIDWIIRLPDGLEDKISEEILNIEEEYKMSYVPTWERKAEQKGREEGARRRDIEIARKLLKKGIALEIISETTNLSRKEIESLDAKH